MLRVALEELVKEVRITLDENASQSAYLKENRDNLELDEIIISKLPEAARDVTESCPIESLDPVEMDVSVTSTEGGGIITLPDDFLRFVSLRMSGWNRSVTSLAAEGSDIDMMQRNPYTRGTSTKPVCVFTHTESGKKAIEYFGSSSSVDKALYMPLPDIEKEGGVDVLPISTLLRKSIVRRAAGLVLLSRGEAELARQFLG